VLGRPLLELDDLERVRRGDERLGKERVGIEGDRGDERFELLGRDLRRLGGGLGGLRGFLRAQDGLPAREPNGSADREETSEPPPRTTNRRCPGFHDPSPLARHDTSAVRGLAGDTWWVHRASTISTRRFFPRFSAVSFSATG
jgi:hypothetical protein